MGRTVAGVVCSNRGGGLCKAGIGIGIEPCAGGTAQQVQVHTLALCTVHGPGTLNHTDTGTAQKISQLVQLGLHSIVYRGDGIVKQDTDPVT